MTQKISRITAYLLIAFFILFMSPLANAHVFVVEETPVPNSTLESSPSNISIEFSNKVDSSFSIYVLNEENEEIDVKETSISEDRKTITSRIPQLPNGQYKVHYFVISSNDGHVIEGNFSFRVEWKSTPSINHDFVKEDTSGTIGKQEKTEIGIGTDLEREQEGGSPGILNYAAKTIYYAGLLLLAGWVLIWHSIQTYSLDVRRKFLFYGMILQLLHLTGLMIFLLVQMNVFTSQGFLFEFDFPMETLFGKLWIVSLMFSLLGFTFLFKNRVFDLLWVLAILLSKSFSGHTQEFEPSFLLVILNSIHLLAAAFWAAGLVYILLFWRNYQLYVKTFLPFFSKGAFISMVFLSISGSMISFFYLPNIEALMTDWGIVLLVKVVIVLGVFTAGAFIRERMKRGRLADLKSSIKLDFLLFILLVILVSILTSLNPLP